MTEDELREPGFYWVLPVMDYDVGHDNDSCQAHWHNRDQPAYWDGERWTLLGTSEWPVRWVGERITVPVGEGFWP